MNHTSLRTVPPNESIEADKSPALSFLPGNHNLDCPWNNLDMQRKEHSLQHFAITLH
jgi:hypothetical protein